MRRALLSLSFVVFTVVVTLGLLEAAIRAFHLMPDYLSLRYRAIAGDEDIAPVPHDTGSSVFGIPFRSNALGLRSPERAVAKPEGTSRVVVVGDSVVWGQGVAEDDGLVPQLERLMTAPGRPAEVWNLGLPATNTFNHAGRFARLAPVLRPDVTVVVLLYNDLAPGPARFRVTAGGSLAVPGRTKLFPDAWKPALERLALYWMPPRLLGHWSAAALSGPGALAHFPAMADRLDAMLGTASSISSRFVVAFVPGRHPPPEQYRALEAKLAEYATQRGIPFVSLASVLGNPVRTDLLLPNDPVHPSAAGHRLIAEALAPLVR